VASIIAYTYTEPVIDKIPDAFFWGCEVDRVYRDIGERKELKKLLKYCHKTPPNYLLIRSLSELGNTLIEVTKLIAKIEEFKIEIISIEENYNTSKFKVIKDSKIKELLINIYQEIEGKIQQQKLKKAHGNNRLKILPPPGKAPFGYMRGKDSYIINRSTIFIVREFFDRFLLYGSLADSVRYIEEKFNKKIALSTAHYWLKNPVYRGDLAYKNQEIIPDTHTAIITREESAQIDRILKSHRLVKSRSASANYALAGLVKCQQCSSSLRISHINKKKYQDKYLYLIPNQCPRKITCKAIKYQEVFEETINKICEQLPLLTQNFQSPNPQLIKKELETEIEAKEKILIQINELIKDNILDEETANIRKYKIYQEIGKIKQKIAQLPPDNLKKISKALSNPQFWEDLSSAECRFYLREFVKTIKIIPLKESNKNWQIILDFIFS
jgi:DNA invertase Pin-like site-specific DNA recombinase